MAYMTIGGQPVSEARPTWPLTGAWHIDALVASADELTGSVEVDFNGALTARGTVLTGGTFVFADRIRILAGAGGWVTPCTPKFYQGATLGTILRALLSAASETLSSTSSAAALAVVLPSFSVSSAALGANVRALMAYAQADTSYRFLPDGSFWVGPETWPEYGEDYHVVDQVPQERRIDVGSNSPALIAGQSIVTPEGATLRINRVETSLSVLTLRQRAWWQS